GRVAANFPDFRAGLDYDLNPDSMLYAMFSTGHKSAGFNDTFSVRDDNGVLQATVAPTFKTEKVYSTEIGSKNQFLDKKITLNASAFWYEYFDQQFNSLQSLVPREQL